MWVIKKLWDLVFPIREDFLIVKAVSLEEWQEKYQVIPTRDWVSLLNFKDPVVKAVIHEAKFHRNEKAQKLLALTLKRHLLKLDGPLYLLPSPLSKVRLKKRGYNQVTEVIKLLDHPNTYTIDRIIKKIKDTKPQASLKRDDRLTNLTGAFAYQPNFTQKLPKTGTIIIVDDVATTGSTLKEIKNALSPHTQLPIICLSLAH